MQTFAEDFFDFRNARHMAAITNYWNDLAWRNDNPYPFAKPRHATYAAYRLGFVYPENRDTLSDAFMIAETWARSVNIILPPNQQLAINYPKPVDYSVYFDPEHTDEPEDDE